MAFSDTIEDQRVRLHSVLDRFVSAADAYEHNDGIFLLNLLIRFEKNRAAHVTDVNE